jgi:UDP-GlcNAc:undecaprenyl-phosphate GlcNAc-1-phosphate transferase
MNAPLFLLVTSFALSFVLTPAVRALQYKLNVIDRPDDSRRFHGRPVARAGGVAVVLSFLLSYALLMILPFAGKGLVLSGLQPVVSLIPALLAIFCTGFLDDVRGLKPWQKLLGQLLAAGLAYWGGARVGGIGGRLLPDPVAFPLTVLWLVGCTNAINLLDGVDGLASGIGLFASSTVVLIGILQGNIALQMAAIPLIGVLLAFLIYNFHPASIFLGDSGSLFIGFLLGCYGVIWNQKSATLLGMTAPLMLLALPFLDTILSITRRYFRHKPILQGDRGHIHHRLIEIGFSVRSVVLILYSFFGLAAIFSLMQSTFEKQYSGVVIVLFCLCFSAGIWVGLDRLGYVEVRLASRMLRQGTFSRRLVYTQLCIWDLERSIMSAPSLDACWLAIGRASRSLGFSSVSMRVKGTRYAPEFAPGARSDRWELRIPLSGSDYIRLGRAFDLNSQDITLTIFIRVLRDVMKIKIKEFEPALSPGESGLTHATRDEGPPVLLRNTYETPA